MMPTPDERLRWARLKLGNYRSASDAARAMGVAPPTYLGHENGSRGLTPEVAERYAKFFRVAPEWLLLNRGSPRSSVAPPSREKILADLRGDNPEQSDAPSTAQEEPNVRFLDPDEGPPFPRLGGPRNVPVLGTAVGGGDDDGDFEFNGETIDYVPRPPSLAHKKQAYALYVENDSMAPKYEAGELLYVDPSRAPAIGDYVVIEVLPTEEGGRGKGFIKRLVRRAGSKIVVEQFNPPKELEFDRERVRVHRVIPWREVIGV